MKRFIKRLVLGILGLSAIALVAALLVVAMIYFETAILWTCGGIATLCAAYVLGISLDNLMDPIDKSIGGR